MTYDWMITVSLAGRMLSHAGRLFSRIFLCMCLQLWCACPSYKHLSTLCW